MHDEQDNLSSRREFLQGIKGWSAIVAGLAVGVFASPQAQAGAWVNRRGGWGGGGWINGQGGWVNRAGAWINGGGGGWINGGGGWVNRRGGSGWVNFR
ncbi:MAG: twin-arginine translocation signal domain-containing protein [Armatimonadetes bacterium]|nr:twin-arginine translocation signal domain-containing protein [Armatimonadota bacterium]